MILRHSLRRIGLAALSLSVAVFGLSASAENNPLSADQIVQKAVQRAESCAANRSSRPDYKYTKRTITEEMDGKGRLKGHKEKLYEVMVESGLSSAKLLQINGENLSSAELKKQQEHDTAERRKMMDTKPGQKGDERENFLTLELVQRYQFTLLGQKQHNGRTSYQISFTPKSGDLPNHKLTDRFLNQVAGVVWIDALEFEVARVEAHLHSEVALWGGIIGTLRQCDYVLERTRLNDGAWFNSFSHGMFEGRKLLEPMTIRTRSQSSDFQRSVVAGN